MIRISSIVLLGLIVLQTSLIAGPVRRGLGLPVAAVMAVAAVACFWLQGRAIYDFHFQKTPQVEFVDRTRAGIALLMSHMFTSIALSGLVFCLRGQ